MKENKTIKDYYKKKYSIITFSGTLAIESILKILKLSKKDSVLISSFSCYSILEAIINSGLNPVVMTPNDGFLFTKDELKKIFSEKKIKVYIAVHQYGYYQEFPIDKKVVIIEDYSQAWNIVNKNDEMHYLGDYIVQSFGKTKPLNFGIGGIICSNNDISKYFDLKTSDDRYKHYPLLEYVLPLNINEKRLMISGNRKVKKIRKIAFRLDKLLSNYDIFDVFHNGNYIPSYHRYVIKIRNSDKKIITEIFEKAKINYQFEYRVRLNEIPLIKKNNENFITNENEFVLMLIKPNNTLYKIKKLEKLLEKYYGKKY